MLWRRKTKTRLADGILNRSTANRHGPKRYFSRAERKRVWQPCQLIWNKSDRTSAMCLEVSQSGARVRSFSRLPSNEVFRFVCPGLGLDTWAQRVRQTGSDLAFKFIETPDD